MFYGVTEYAAFAAVVCLIVHSFVRNYALACFVAAITSAIGNLAYVTWVANFQVKPGWVVPILIMGFGFALPISFVGGVPHFLWRKCRRQVVGDIRPPAAGPTTFSLRFDKVTEQHGPDRS